MKTIARIILSSSNVFLFSVDLSVVAKIALILFPALLIVLVLMAWHKRKKKNGKVKGQEDEKMEMQQEEETEAQKLRREFQNRTL
jgi:hypothetical protein